MGYLASLVTLASVASLCGCNTYVDILTLGIPSARTQIPQSLRNALLELAKLDLKLSIGHVLERLGDDAWRMQFVQDRATTSVTTSATSATTSATTTSTTTPAPTPKHIPNQLCVNQTGQVFAGLLRKETWALQMFDAAGKPGSGLMQFQVQFLGNYEECVAVTASPSRSTPLIHGKYCLANVPLVPNAPRNPGNIPNANMGLSIGICVPASCKEADVTLILNNFLEWALRQVNVSVPFRFYDTVCQEENLPLDTTAIIVFSVAMVFVALLVIGTVFDVIFVQSPRWRAAERMEGVDRGTLINGGDEINGSFIKRQLDESIPLLDPEKVVVPKSRILWQVLLSFSVYTNTLKVLSTKETSGTLTAVHGIRFMSMTWVMLGHALAFGLVAVDNVATIPPIYFKRFTFQGVCSALIAADTFFVISGLLVAYLTLKEMKKTGGKINWLMFYVHRYWRLTPVYMLVLMVYVPLFGYVTTGPLWKQDGIEVNKCRDTWWTNLLYINNLVHKDEMCMGWSWYLANDMQFYILSPLLIVPFFYSGVFGTLSVLVFLLAAMIAPGVVSRLDNLPPTLALLGPKMGNNSFPNANSTNTAGILAYFNDYYVVPWCRMGPYIVGIFTGYILYRTDCKVKLSKLTALIGWSVATASALAVVYGLYDAFQGHSPTPDVSAFYNSVHRTVWGACVSWVIFACATGYGGIVNTLLSWKVMVPLSRLTYCAYLVHPIVMMFVFLSEHTLIHITDNNMICWFVGLAMISYMAAFVTSMTFELPMMGIGQAFFKREKSS